jgi:hypothetical protein
MDPRYLKEIKEKLAAAREKNSRPGLEGHSAEVDALYLVANQIRLLINATTQSTLPFIDGPAGPADLIEAQYYSESDALVDAALGNPGGE